MKKRKRGTVPIYGRSRRMGLSPQDKNGMCPYLFHKAGLTLVEMLVACAIMVIVFALIAVIFGRAYTISSAIKRGSKAERWGVSLMNTILYGAGRTNLEGLIAANRIYNTTDTKCYFPKCDESRCLSFYTPNGAIIYELASTAQSLYRNIKAGDTGADYDPTYIPPPYPYKYFDLKPTYAKEGKLEICDSSGFYFYDESNNPVTDTEHIKRVGIRLVVKSALQSLNQAIILYQNVRIRNLYSLE